MFMIEIDTFHKLFGDYSRKLPLIFGRHFLTQRLLEQVRQGVVLNELPFTVTIVGQMRNAYRPIR
ncbi:MAG: hypothetical protein LBJ00_03855 [Planctomycetaceae bacterium]|jgi:hypothetical protein|nr:hypothetical protein [Planctomycetaceae bacterium]